MATPLRAETRIILIVGKIYIKLSQMGGAANKREYSVQQRPEAKIVKQNNFEAMSQIL